MMSRRAKRHQILAAAFRQRRRRHPGDLRVFGLERRRLAHLPANQLIEVRDFAGTFSKRSSETFAAVSGITSATRRGRDAELVERGAQRRRQRAPRRGR